MLHAYEWSLARVLRHPRATIVVDAAHDRAYRISVLCHPKGLFPIEDTGFINCGTEASEDTSFQGMVEKQLRIDAIIRFEPLRGRRQHEIGLGGLRMGVNTGSCFVELKPRDQRPPSMT